MGKCHVTKITAKDIGCHGYVIKKPGIYKLTEDVCFNPKMQSTLVTITDAGGGTGAEAYAAVSDGVVRGLFVVNGGSNYVTPVVTITGKGTGASFTANVSGGNIVSFTQVSGGWGYEDTIRAAITVRAKSNVRINLGGHAISQAGKVEAANLPNYQAGLTQPSNQVPFIVGIFIPDLAPDVNQDDYVAISSVFIYNGILDGMSMWGVLQQGHVEDVRYKCLTIKNIASLASYYLRPFATYTPNGFPYGYDPVQGAVPMSVGGMGIGETDIFGLGPHLFTQRSGVTQYRAQQIQFENVHILDCFFIGLMGQNTTGARFNNVRISGTYSDDPGVYPVGVAFGLADQPYETPSMDSFEISKCSIENTQYKGDNQTQLYIYYAATGMVNWRSANMRISELRIANVTTSFLTDVNNITSFGMITASLVNAVYENCQVENVVSTGVINMWHLSGNSFYGGEIQAPMNVQMINCQVGNGTVIPVTNNNGGNAPVGFVLYYCQGLRMTKCTAMNLTAVGQAAYGTGGFQIVDGPESQGGGFGNVEEEYLIFENCSAQNIIAQQGSNATGFSVDPFDGPGNRVKTILFDRCTAQGCQSIAVPGATPSAPPIQSTAQGFQLSNTNNTDVSYAILYRNCVAQDCQGAASTQSGGFVAFSTDATQSTIGTQYEGCQSHYNVNGFSIQNCKQFTFRNCRSDFNVANATNTSADGVYGSGFLDLGPGLSGTITNPNASGSLYESCRACENGNTLTHTGANGNYNVVYGSGLTPLPLLQGNLSTQIVPVPVPQAAFTTTGTLLVPVTTSVSTTAS